MNAAKRNFGAIKHIFLVGMLLTVTYVAKSQELNGRVIDFAQGEPLEYASIALYNLSDSGLVAGVITDEQGTFSIKGMKEGSYYLIGQFLGYEPLTISDIKLKQDQHLNLGTLKLEPNQKLLKEIEITGEKLTAIHKIDRQVYTAEKFQTARGGTATDLIRNMPSVSVDALGNISVRGATGFVVLLNGKPIQTDATTVLNQLPANAIENIELITVPSAKYDPEGKGGIINILTKKGATDGLFLQVNGRYGLPSIAPYDNAENAHRYGGDLVMNYRKDKWDVSFGFNYLRNDISGRREGNVNTTQGDRFTSFPSDGERSFDEINYSGRFTVGYSPGKNNEINLGFFAGKRTKDRTADILYFNNRAERLSTGEELYAFQYFNENLRVRKGDFVLGSLDYAHTFGNQSSLKTSLLFEYTLLGGPTTNLNLNPETGFVYQDEFNTNDNPLNGIRYQLDYSLKPMEWGKIEVGYQFRSLDHTGDFIYERRNNETGDFELVPEFSSEVDLLRSIHSGYGVLSGGKGKWNYGVGLRIEVMDRELTLKDKAGTLNTTFDYDFVQAYPSANLQYAMTSDFRLKAAYSRRVERTTTFKMNPFPEREHSETLEQGDPELLPEFIDVVELGAVKDIGDHSFFGNVYYRHVNNLVNRVNTVFNDTILNRIYSNVGTGRSLGFELGMELKPTNWWQLFLGGNTYEYRVKGVFDNRPVNTSSWVYNINLNTTFDIGKAISLQWTLNYISDRNTAQGEDSRFLSPNLTLQKTFLDNRLSTTLQWLNMDAGLLSTNEQRITTSSPGEFFTTTNYVYEVDVLMINISYRINKIADKTRFIKSEFGEKEF
ncbi:TonB-dependent receptor [Fulvivirga sp. M361]|uniref:TonB-dependent receptor domain-containing protein n=1 Tax=Fulvivirga sp. M361 TaxID=2594266 RepID=UPI00117A82C0|nr:TonB-dependent receptor [Fulvivirga sp. M361]TRX48560.1 TonB-dependent receptor [Fulvivirga sp. M361]